MITQQQAEHLEHVLLGLGRPWRPAAGDRFTIPGRDLDGVFVIADMVIEVADLPSGPLLQFNGTTEWALDSVEAGVALWIPWEHQLREMLGERLVSLVRRPDTTWAVTLDDGSEHLGDEPEQAYLAGVVSLHE